VLKKDEINGCVRHLKNVLTNFPSSWYRIFREQLIVIQVVKKFHDFVEPEGSAPCSQIPFIGPYPESVQNHWCFLTSL
jgi:hypothetical protein